MKKFWLSWLALAGSSTILTIMIFGAVHQNYRQSADDPQVQLAEDAATYIENQTFDCQHTGPFLDISQSLAPFIDTYSPTGQPVNICSTGVNAPVGQLGGAAPTLPQGVFDYAKANGEDRITWQPRSDLRFAAVVRYYSGSQKGYVLAARSLREVERRTNELAQILLIMWGVSIALSWGIYYLVDRRLARN